jgi:stage V sporulation protein B
LTKQSFVKGAAILTIAGFFARAAGALFRIALAALIGDGGVGLYQMSYPVYSIMLAVSTAGIPTAISKLVAENLTYGNYRGAYRIFTTAKIILFLSGFLFSLLLFAGAEYIVAVFGLDPRAVYSLAATSPAIFLVTLMSAYRGFFQGQQQMRPTAVSQVVEQIFRVIAAVILIVVLLPRGIAHAAAGASIGTAAGAFCGLFYLIIMWWRQKGSFLAIMRKQKSADQETALQIVRNIFALAIPITVGSLVMPLINLVDLSLVPRCLQLAGFSMERATALYGQLTGMATPLVHIPTIITLALAISLVPAVSEALALGRKRLLQEREYMAVRVTVLLGLPCVAGLYILAEPLCLLLYNNGKAGIVLAALAPGVIFLTLYQTTAAILQGLGRSIDPVVALFWGALVKIGLTRVLTAHPFLHIRGAALATVLGFATAALLNVSRIQSLTAMPLRPLETIVKPLLATAVMGTGIFYLYPFLESLFLPYFQGRAGDIAVLLSVAFGAVFYLLFLLLLGGIRRSDLLIIPGAGQFLVRVAEKFHLLRS